MILSYDDIIALCGEDAFNRHLKRQDLEKIMQEVERRTAEETRDKICNKLDDWIHGMCYEY